MMCAVNHHQVAEKPGKKAPSKALRAFRRVKNILFGVLFVLLVLTLIVILVARINGETPKLFGFAVYRVSSASMVPYLKVGDIILCRDCDPMTLKAGDVITYNGTVGEFEGKKVTHRVVKEPYLDQSDGTYYLLTKGDDNPSEDSPVAISQVTGKLISKIGFLKVIYNFFITPWGLITIIALILIAFSNEIYHFILSVVSIRTIKDASDGDISKPSPRNQADTTDES